MVLAVFGRRRNHELVAVHKQGLSCTGVGELGALDRWLSAPPEPVGAVVLDVTGFDRAVWSRCERMHRTGIPVVALASGQSGAVRSEALARGARQVMDKPVTVHELVALVRALLSA